ncbi:hypothetical protein B7463_g4158, partial [Scytalidium lignicola]
MEGLLGSHATVSTRVLSLNIFLEWKTVGRCKSNCPRIEVDILYPLPLSPSDSFTSTTPSTPSCAAGSLTPLDTSADHVNAKGDMMAESASDDESSEASCMISKRTRLLDLPLELRLRIYGYLLPARTHKIVTQIPHNGFFYNTGMIPEHSATSFYPFGRCGPKERLTTYKVLTTNFRPDFPEPSIYPSILQTCKQIRQEAEPILYGAKQTVFDFGPHLEASQAFFRDRSSLARQYVKNIKIAREIPCLDQTESLVAAETDPLWVTFCNYLISDLPNLRTIDLTLWSSSGSRPPFPLGTPLTISGIATTFGYGESEDEVASAILMIRQWKEWDWTENLFNSTALVKTKVTWWQFNSLGENHFDSWLAKRMAIDSAVKDKMVRNGVLTECSAIL